MRTVLDILFLIGIAITHEIRTWFDFSSLPFVPHISSTLLFDLFLDVLGLLSLHF
jgi:hypothetical protein